MVWVGLFWYGVDRSGTCEIGEVCPMKYGLG